VRDTIRSKEYFDTFILEEEEDGIKAVGKVHGMILI